MCIFECTQQKQIKMAAPAKSTPKDAQVMMAILNDMGLTDYEPRVVNQMLEFTYRKCKISRLNCKPLFIAQAKFHKGPTVRLNSFRLPKVVKDWLGTLINFCRTIRSF